MPVEHPFAHLLLVGGRACLDFCNTVEYYDTEARHEWLKTYSDLVHWGVYAQTVLPDVAPPLLQAAELSPEVANGVFQQALALREAMYLIFTAHFTAQSIPQDSADILNSALSSALSHLQLVASAEDRFQWAWNDNDALDRVLWPVLRSAADVLTSDDLAHVRQCPGCGWLFVDESKNHSRTWCDMRICGNRAKRRRYYRRSKAAD